MTTMRFTTFTGIYDNTPKPYEGWSEFKELFQLQVVPDKHSVPLYCPAEYVNDRRADDNVLHVSFGVVDIDTATQSQVLDAVAALASFNLQIIFHTTHSHHEGLAKGFYKCRIIVPFSRPVEPEEWSRVWHGLNELVGGIADTQCKNASRIYYFPSCPPEGEGSALVESYNEDGVPLDIDFILQHITEVPDESQWIPDFDPTLLYRVDADVRVGLAKTYLDKYPVAVQGAEGDARTLKAGMIGRDFGLSEEEYWPLFQDYNERCKPPWKKGDLRKKLNNAYKYGNMQPGWRLLGKTKGDPVEKAHVEKVAREWAAKTGDLGATGRHLQKILSGDPIGVDSMQIFESVAKALADHFKSADPHTLAAALKDSIEATNKAGHRDITLAFMVARIKDVQSANQADRAQMQHDQQVRARVTIQDAYRSVGIADRSTSYSKEEWDRFVSAAGLSSPQELKQRLVIRCGPSYYFFVAGEYSRRPYKEDAYDMCQRALAPARVDLFREGAKGPVPMKLPEIMSRYGTVAREIMLDMSATKSSFDSGTQIFTEAPCPLRILPEEAEFDQRVDTWLRLMGGPMAHKLLDWVACVPMLDQPIAGLFLYGRKKSGKSFLPHAIARLWLNNLQGGPASLQSVANTDFNDGLKKCPILFADEGQIPLHKGTQDPNTNYLRDLIQAVSQDWKPKGFANGTIKGAYRVMISANDPDKLVGRYSWLTNDAISAINERILCVKIGDNKATHFLEKLKKDPSNRDFFMGDVVAKHVWWLHQHRKVKYESRFLVAGLRGSELEMSLMTGSGARATICQWLTEYLLKSEDARHGGGVGERPVFSVGRRGSARYLITSKILDTLWGTVLPAVQMPAHSVLGKALGALSHRQVVKVSGEDGVRRDYRAVHIGRLKYWAVNDGYGEEVFDAALKRAGIPIPKPPVWWSREEWDEDEDEDEDY